MVSYTDVHIACWIFIPILHSLLLLVICTAVIPKSSGQNQDSRYALYMDIKRSPCLKELQSCTMIKEKNQYQILLPFMNTSLVLLQWMVIIFYQSLGSLWLLSLISVLQGWNPDLTEINTNTPIHTLMGSGYHLKYLIKVKGDLQNTVQSGGLSVFCFILLLGFKSSYRVGLVFFLMFFPSFSMVVLYITIIK